MRAPISKELLFGDYSSEEWQELRIRNDPYAARRSKMGLVKIIRSLADDERYVIRSSVIPSWRQGSDRHSTHVERYGPWIDIGIMAEKGSRKNPGKLAVERFEQVIAKPSVEERAAIGFGYRVPVEGRRPLFRVYPFSQHVEAGLLFLYEFWKYPNESVSSRRQRFSEEVTLYGTTCHDIALLGAGATVAMASRSLKKNMYEGEVHGIPWVYNSKETPKMWRDLSFTGGVSKHARRMSHRFKSGEAIKGGRDLLYVHQIAMLHKIRSVAKHLEDNPVAFHYIPAFAPSKRSIDMRARLKRVRIRDPLDNQGTRCLTLTEQDLLLWTDALLSKNVYTLFQPWERLEKYQVGRFGKRI